VWRFGEGFEVQGVAFGVQGLGFRVWRLGFSKATWEREFKLPWREAGAPKNSLCHGEAVPRLTYTFHPPVFQIESDLH